MLVIYFLSAILNEGLSVFISGSSFLPVLSISNTFLMLKTPNHSLLLKGPMFSVHCSESSHLKAYIFLITELFEIYLDLIRVNLELPVSIL